MNNQLIISPNDNDADFVRKLNQAINYQNQARVPILKFNAKEGLWYRENGEQDAEGKPVFENIGEMVIFHVVALRKQVQSSMEAAEQLFSKEFQDNFVVLYNQEKKEVLRGMYNALKMANPDLQYNQVLYVYMEEQLYKIRLGGMKLSKWFPYLASFKNDSPSRYLTIAERGQLIKQKLNNGREVSNYELNFSRGDLITDKQLIISRVNGVNEYLAAKANRTVTAETATEYLPEEEPPVSEPLDINVNDVI